MLLIYGDERALNEAAREERGTVEVRQIVELNPVSKG